MCSIVSSMYGGREEPGRFARRSRVKVTSDQSGKVVTLPLPLL